MLAVTADCYDDICNDPRVRAQIDSLDSNQDSALRRSWTRTGGSLLFAAIAFALLHRAGWDFAALIVALVAGIGGLLWGFSAQMEFTDNFKRPVLEALAARAGIEYQMTGFNPPAYADARKALIGMRHSCDTFEDLFRGKDESGLNFAAYHAHIHSGGKTDVVFFTGQFFAMERRSLSSDTTLIVPPEGFFSLSDPPAGMQRVAFDLDRDFEAAFDVYATSGAEALQLLSDAKLREWLVDLQVNGPLFAYIAPTDALFGVSGDNPCDPGPATEYESAWERLRPMFDGVCEMFATLAEMKARFG